MPPQLTNDLTSFYSFPIAEWNIVATMNKLLYLRALMTSFPLSVDSVAKVSRWCVGFCIITVAHNQHDYSSSGGHMKYIYVFTN